MSELTFAEFLQTATVQRDKACLHQYDFVAEQGWRVIRELKFAQPLVFEHSFVLIKPEAKARRLSEATLTCLRQRGFSPIASVEIPLDRNMSHLLWRFQWNAATTDRVELTNLINARSSSTLILLRDQKPSRIPASVKTWRIKGSAHAEKRTPAHLRSILNMHNRMIGFVHMPDEPADFVRELSILLPPDRLLDLIEQAMHSNQPQQRIEQDVKLAVAEVEASTRSHSVLPDEVLERLRNSNSLPGQVRRWISDGVHPSLAEVLRVFQERGDTWDALTIAAELILHDKPGVKPALEALAVDEVAERWETSGDELKRTFLGAVYA